MTVPLSQLRIQILLPARKRKQDQNLNKNSQVLHKNEIIRLLVLRYVRQNSQKYHQNLVTHLRTQKKLSLLHARLLFLRAPLFRRPARTSLHTTVRMTSHLRNLQRHCPTPPLLTPSVIRQPPNQEIRQISTTLHLLFHFLKTKGEIPTQICQISQLTPL